ncbi:hypothetical protein QBC43DRAFT_352045 [Cladorrhinum sp. PSN259]|nr:hypothetical protein QBC43DRAFT_352045 [Cladorrhinum sp. PSN259]
MEEERAKTRGQTKIKQAETAAANPPTNPLWVADDVQKSADEIAPIFKLSRDLRFQREENENEYAPSQEGSYYVHIQYTQAGQGPQMQFVLCDPDISAGRMDQKHTFDGYVPIAFLAALGPDSVKWGELNEEKELDFIEGWRDLWMIPKRRFSDSYKKSECWVPIRTSTGVLQFRCTGPLGMGDRRYYKEPDVYKSLWYDILNATWTRRSTPPEGKPPRWARVAVPDGIRVLFDPIKTAGIDDAVLEEFVATVNQSNIKDRAGLEERLEDAKKRRQAATNWNDTDKCQKDLDYFEKRWKESDWELKRVKEVPPSTWLKLSTNPYELYSTYISKKDWNVYMKTLAEDVSDPQDRLKLVRRPPTEALPTTTTKMAAVQDIHKLFLDTLATNITAASIRQALHLKAATRAEHDYDHLRQLVDGNHFHAFESGIRFMGTASHKKIETATGKRDGEHQQSTIMKGSANQVAAELGWSHDNTNKKDGRKDNQMRNWLYTAEWLHLRAYAWGGHLDAEDEYQGLTSQNPLNLVLGTSETNSIMVRYEKAWQNLFTFEHKLQDVLGGTPPKGQLWIRTNPENPNKPIGLNDAEGELCDNAKWGTGGIEMMEVDQYDSSAGDNNWFTIKEQPITTAMRDISKTYRWIAHSIAYYVNMTTPSLALGLPNQQNPNIFPELFVKFYPFQRSFFHRAESSLDGLLFGELKRQAKLKAVSLLTVGDQDYEKKKKEIMGKDYEDTSKQTGSGSNPPGGRTGTGGSTTLTDRTKSQHKGGRKKRVDLPQEDLTTKRPFTSLTGTDAPTTGHNDPFLPDEDRKHTDQPRKKDPEDKAREDTERAGQVYYPRIGQPQQQDQPGTTFIPPFPQPQYHQPAQPQLDPIKVEHDLFRQKVYEESLARQAFEQQQALKQERTRQSMQQHITQRQPAYRIKLQKEDEEYLAKLEPEQREAVQEQRSKKRGGTDPLSRQFGQQATEQGQLFGHGFMTWSLGQDTNGRYEEMGEFYRKQMAVFRGGHSGFWEFKAPSAHQLYRFHPAPILNVVQLNHWLILGNFQKISPSY